MILNQSLSCCWNLIATWISYPSVFWSLRVPWCRCPSEGTPEMSGALDPRLDCRPVDSAGSSISACPHVWGYPPFGLYLSPCTQGALGRRPCSEEVLGTRCPRLPANPCCTLLQLLGAADPHPRDEGATASLSDPSPYRGRGLCPSPCCALGLSPYPCRPAGAAAVSDASAAPG